MNSILAFSGSHVTSPGQQMLYIASWLKYPSAGGANVIFDIRKLCHVWGVIMVF